MNENDYIYTIEQWQKQSISYIKDIAILYNKIGQESEFNMFCNEKMYITPETVKNTLNRYLKSIKVLYNEIGLKFNCIGEPINE